MTFITIQCRLIANEETLRYLWDLMYHKNTPMVNELLERLANHPSFETWLKNSELPEETVENICDFLKKDPRFAGQSGRFYTSVSSLVKYIYKSWLALQKGKKDKIKGKERWLQILKSDSELEQASNSSLETIRAKAAKKLNEISTQLTEIPNKKIKTKKAKKAKKQDSEKASPNTYNMLMDAYKQARSPLSRCAIAYLLKNNCQLSDREEDLEKLAQRRRTKEIEIERLKKQLKSRIPKGRDLTAEKWLETLAIATTTVPKDENEAKNWQAILLRKSSSMPFPISYETNEDMVWHTNEKGRIFVSFNGLGEEHIFEVWCSKRQLHWFKRFLQDQQTKKDSKDQHSSSLFTLRSGRLVWQKSDQKGEPWQVNHLYLHCSVDTRLWTMEGTQQVAQEKAAIAEKQVANASQKSELTLGQQRFVKRKQSTLARINQPFPRPSEPLYQGQPSILVGISFGLEKPATVAVVDASTKKVLAYSSVKQLLGKNNHLLNRRRYQQQSLAHQRYKAQKNFANNSFGESELGEYIDRLLAKEIIAIAKTYQAGSIVLPKLADMREILHSEVAAKAEQKIPGYKEGQAKYAKDYRVNIHRWSYGRVIDNIQSQAAKAGIAVEVGLQPLQGSPQEKARDLAIAAYQSRQLL